MSPKGKKNNKKDGPRRKADTDGKVIKIQQIANETTKSTNRDGENLNTYFKNEEIQEIKTALKCKDLSGLPYIIGAAILNKSDTMKILLKSGQNINETWQNHTTALMCAVKCKNLEIIELLLLKGADPTIKNDNGDNTLMLALENKLWDELSFMRFWNMVKSLTFIDVDYISKNKRTMLHIATSREWCHFVDVLIAEKALVNATNKNGLTPLMLASFRNNINLVNVLLNAGADVTKEDNAAYSALSYAISSIIRRNISKPHSVIHRLQEELLKNEIWLKDYVKQQVESIVNPLYKLNKSIQAGAEMIVHIIKYVIQNVEDGTKMLLEFDIFEKLTKAAKKHFEDVKYLKSILLIIRELMDQKTSNEDVENSVVDGFIANNGMDMCLTVLKKYGFESAYNWILSASLYPLMHSYLQDERVKIWLEIYYHEMQPFYEKFLEITEISGSTTDEMPGRLEQLKELVNRLKRGKTRSKHSIKNKPEIKSPRSLTDDFNEEQITGSQLEDFKYEVKSNSKKTKRRIKAMKAEINKAKTAELTGRLSLNVKKEAERKSDSSTSITQGNCYIEEASQTEIDEPNPKNVEEIQKQILKHNRNELQNLSKSPEETNHNQFETFMAKLDEYIDVKGPTGLYNYVTVFKRDKPENISLWTFLNTQPSVIDPALIKKFNLEANSISQFFTYANSIENNTFAQGLYSPQNASDNFIDEYFDNQIVRDIKTMLNRCQFELIKEETDRYIQRCISLYPDWKTKLTDDTNKTKFIQLTSDHQENFKSIEYSPKPAHEEENMTLNQAIGYLIDLLEKIVFEYKTLWKCDQFEENNKNLEECSSKSTYDENKCKALLAKLQDEHIEHLNTEFDKLIGSIKHIAPKYVEECHIVINKLEKVLLNHKIRGKLIMVENSALEVISVNRTLDENYAEVIFERHDDASLSTYLENVLTGKQERYVNIVLSPAEPKSSPEMETSPHQIYPDDLYIKEVSMLPRKKLLTRDEYQQAQKKEETDKLNTMSDAYHLVPSILALCENDHENSQLTKANKKHKIIRNSNMVCGTPSKTKIACRKRPTLQEDLSTLPKFSPIEFAGSFCKNQTGCSSLYTSSDISRSRWCTLMRSLQMMTNCQYFLSGEVRISCKEKRPSHIIATGGNFSPVELGLDASDRPLAVKRIYKSTTVTTSIKNMINPLLGLRSTHLLHYFSCNYEDNELILATPLCEFNIGQYIMLMKQSPNLCLLPINIVRQFLAGIRFLHDRVDPIIHGNLKPSNIFVDINGMVRIAEFGMYKALFKLIRPPNSSIIWFARETFNNFKEINDIDCTSASDIQVAGMLIHFVITAGKHPYGEKMEDILKNMENSIPLLQITDVDLHDLISWMLLYDPLERPSINQVLSHVFFWCADRKWRFILACAGVGPYGIQIQVSLEELHAYIDRIATKENIKGSWIKITREKFPNIISNEDDSPTGLLRFVRACIQQKVFIYGDTDILQNFILNSFPAFPLSLYRILESTAWLEQPVFKPFTTVDSVAA